MDLGWIGGGLAWIGVDWPCFHVQLCTQNVGICENGEAQNFREQGSFIILKETRRTEARAGANMRCTHAVGVLRILHRRRQSEEMMIRILHKRRQSEEMMIRTARRGNRVTSEDKNGSRNRRS